MDLSIIIVTYNSEKYIKNCISSIFNNTNNINYEVIVVDNCSTDATVTILKEISFNNKNVTIVHSENKGFNHGNNEGIKISKGKYICLLNPDTILMNNAFKIIIDGMEMDKSLGMAGGKLFDDQGNPNLTFGCFPSLYNTIIRNIKLMPYKYFFANTRKKKLLVPYPSGADFVIRREVIDEVGYMDENYFLYFDETDFAFRIKKAGYRACIFTEAKIIHLQGKSTEEVSEFSRMKFLESYIYYNKKNKSKIESVLMCWIQILQYKVKLLIKRGNKKNNLEEIEFYLKALDSIKNGGNIKSI